jgi:sugar (pentulose or hexulose) kinase
MFSEFASLMGYDVNISDVYERLYVNAMTSAPDCEGVVAFNYLSGEHITGIETGRPMYFRVPDGKMTLAAFMRAQLSSSVAVMKLGVDLLRKKEGIEPGTLTAHGGLFKVKGVAQTILADALNATVSVSKTAGEGGAWGMALLAAYSVENNGAALDKWLNERVFSASETYTVEPSADGVEGFNKYTDRYLAALKAEAMLGEVK